MDPLTNPGELALSNLPANTPAVPDSGNLPSIADFLSDNGDGGGWLPQNPAVPANPAAPANPAPIIIAGKSYTPEQAADLIEKGANATQKWQEAADLKRQAEAIQAQAEEGRVLSETWNRLSPAMQSRVLEMIQEANQSGPAARSPMALPASAPGQMNWNQLSEGEQFVYGQAANAIAALNAQVTELAGIVHRLAPAVQDMNLRDQDVMASQALALKGFKVSPAEVKELRERGVGNVVAAYEAFGPKLKEQFATGAQQGTQAAAQQPPAAPVTQTNTFNPDDYTADQIVGLLARGFVPVGTART